MSSLERLYNYIKSNITPVHVNVPRLAVNAEVPPWRLVGSSSHWDAAGSDSEKGYSRDQITEGLYLGNFGAAQQAHCEFTAVVCCAPQWQVRSDLPTFLFDIVAILKTRPEFQIKELRKLISFVGAQLLPQSDQTNPKILFHCRAGKHRAAASMCCMMLAVDERIEALEAIRQVESRRRGAHVHGNLRRFVFDVERMQRPLA